MSGITPERRAEIENACFIDSIMGAGSGRDISDLLAALDAETRRADKAERMRDAAVARAEAALALHVPVEGEPDYCAVCTYEDEKGLQDTYPCRTRLTLSAPVQEKDR